MLRAYLIVQVASWGLLFGLLALRQFDDDLNRWQRIILCWLAIVQAGAALAFL